MFRACGVAAQCGRQLGSPTIDAYGFDGAQCIDSPNGGNDLSRSRLDLAFRADSTVIPEARTVHKRIAGGERAFQAAVGLPSSPANSAARAT